MSTTSSAPAIIWQITDQKWWGPQNEYCSYDFVCLCHCFSAALLFQFFTVVGESQEGHLAGKNLPFIMKDLLVEQLGEENRRQLAKSKWPWKMAINPCVCILINTQVINIQQGYNCTSLSDYCNKCWKYCSCQSLAKSGFSLFIVAVTAFMTSSLCSRLWFSVTCVTERNACVLYPTAVIEFCMSVCNNNVIFTFRALIHPWRGTSLFHG